MAVSFARRDPRGEARPPSVREEASRGVHNRAVHDGAGVRAGAAVPPVTDISEPLSFKNCEGLVLCCIEADVCK